MEEISEAEVKSTPKKIAKNTLFLYIRMFIMLAVSLFTARIVLQALGVSDYGIYSIVGGFVAMFAIVSGSISASISRYLAFEIGNRNFSRLSRAFSTSIIILTIVSAVIILLAETVGLWFLNVKMNIPAEKMVAANWVYQLSIVTFIINLISLPYNAAIIAHEKMSVFAYISLLEAVGKLLIAYIILFDFFDNLIVYAALMCLLACIIRVVYTIYCKRHFPECKFTKQFDKPFLKEMFGFAGWNFIGASSAMLRDQGGMVVINLFFGTVVNAACGIAAQVNNAVTGFVVNFMTALNPQITKSYANQDYDYMMKLIFQGARLSFFMLLLISLPLMVNIDFILSIWLTTVPGYTSLFIVLIITFAMCESISNPLITAMLATGNIRNYQIVVGGLQMLNLPVSYILLANGLPPQSVYITAIVISQLCLAARLIFLRGLINLDIKKYLGEVYFKAIAVSALSAFIPLLLKPWFTVNFGGFAALASISVIWTVAVIYAVGLSSTDRVFVNNKLKMAFSKFRNDKD